MHQLKLAAMPRSEYTNDVDFLSNRDSASPLGMASLLAGESLLPTAPPPNASDIPLCTAALQGQINASAATFAACRESIQLALRRNETARHMCLHYENHTLNYELERALWYAACPSSPGPNGRMLAEYTLELRAQPFAPYRSCNIAGYPGKIVHGYHNDTNTSCYCEIADDRVIGYHPEGEIMDACGRWNKTELDPCKAAIRTDCPPNGTLCLSCASTLVACANVSRVSPAAYDACGVPLKTNQWWFRYRPMCRCTAAQTQASLAHVGRQAVRFPYGTTSDYVADPTLLSRTVAGGFWYSTPAGAECQEGHPGRSFVNCSWRRQPQLIM